MLMETNVSNDMKRLEEEIILLKRAEITLRSQQDYLMAILNSIADPICIKDSKHRWVLVNDEFCAVAGQDRETLVGKSDYEFFPKNEADVFWKMDEEVLQTGTENISEETITGSDGVTRNLVTKKTLYRDPSEEGFVVAIGRDVTDRKRVEQALRENEEFLRLVIDTTPAHIFVKDRNGKFLLVNNTAAKAHGITPEEMIGKNELELAGSSVEKAAQIKKFLADDRKIIDTKKPKYIPEEPLTLSDGSIQWLQTTKIPLKLKGDLDCVLGVAVDVTARKKAEQELWEKEELLRQSQKMEAIGRLAGGIAHDFNNLLTAIIGYAEMLKLNTSLDTMVRHSVEEIRKSADRAAVLTQQLLAFGRKQIMQPSVLDVNSLISDTRIMLNRLIGEHITLETKLNAQPSSIKADPGQIEQVIVNLVVNARDSMPGGGTITLETSNAREVVRALDETVDVERGEFVVVSIGDTGHGIDGETKQHIFEPFFTTKEKGKGTGLGLSTVYGIVTQSGGHISVESQVDWGTVFKVYLPITEALPKQPPGESLRTVSKGKSESVLVVEDEGLVRDMMCEVLKSYGFNVLEADSGERALEGGSEGIDLLITDVIMPGISGTELADEFLKHHPALKVLFVSGYTGDEIAHHGILNESVLFLQKPFSPQTLVEKVHEILKMV
jgi:PAS domain S-box-containing protein